MKKIGSALAIVLAVLFVPHPISALEDTAEAPPLSRQRTEMAVPADILETDCLVAGVMEGGEELVARLAKLVGRFDGQTDPAEVVQNPGRIIGAPSLKGIDLREPARFYLMNPKKYTKPWVYQFKVRDVEALKWGLMVHGLDGHVLRLDGRMATWGGDARAVDAVAAGSQGTGDTAGISAVEVRARVHVARVMEVYGEEFREQVGLMKGRMREALETRAPSVVEAKTAQMALDLIASIARQVRELDVRLKVTGEFARLHVKVTPLSRTALETVLAGYQRQASSLISSCPDDVTLAVAYDSEMTRLARGLVMETLMKGFSAAAGSSADGERVTAIRLAPEEAVPGEAPIHAIQNAEIMDIAQGVLAAKARDLWAELAAEAQAESAKENEAQPGAVSPQHKFVKLSVIDQPGGEVGMHVAEMMPDGEGLGGNGKRIFRRVLGERPLAAQFCPARPDEKEWTISAVGVNPVERIKQIKELTERESLAQTLAFRKTMEGLPENPDAVFYVSPEGVRRWLKLGATERAPGAELLGFGIVLSLRDGEVRGGMSLPIGAVVAQ